MWWFYLPASACVCECKWICVYVFVCAWMNKYVCVLCTCIKMLIHLHVCMFICICEFMHVVYIHMNVCLFVHACVHICIYMLYECLICMCVYVGDMEVFVLSDKHTGLFLHEKECSTCYLPGMVGVNVLTSLMTLVLFMCSEPFLASSLPHLFNEFIEHIFMDFSKTFTVIISDQYLA